MPTLSLTSPAKLNLLLAVTGRRSDGFHELVSIVAPLAWGDTLAVETDSTEANDRTLTAGAGQDGATAGAGAFSLVCDDAAVPVGESNLVLKAAQAFRAASGWRGGARFLLQKRIPMGAGLGGGSSNAAAALRALNRLAGEPLSGGELAAAAASVGSDCALFLHDAPVAMRGRGERVEPLPAAVANRFRGRSVLVFKPAFGIPTAWAYARLAAGAPASYLPAAEAEARVARWIADGSGADGTASAQPAGEEANGRRDALDDLLFNNMEPPAFAKFPALPLLLDQLRRDFGLHARMSGSGSACFALLPEDAPRDAIEAAIRRSWGQSVFVVHTRFA